MINSGCPSRWKLGGWRIRVERRLFATYYFPTSLILICTNILPTSKKQWKNSKYINKCTEQSRTPLSCDSHAVCGWAADWSEDPIVHVTVIRMYLSGGQKPVITTYTSLQHQLSFWHSFSFFHTLPLTD